MENWNLAHAIQSPSYQLVVVSTYRSTLHAQSLAAVCPIFAVERIGNY
jgi:hypothetical protein